MKNSRQEGEKLFQAAYQKLNQSQREAVDTIEGPVMVVAGPGTGKTQILTLRIANILLKTDTPPDGILALTFTESGAKAMRERLRAYIGSTAYQVPIYTFHGFAQSLIGKYPDAYDRVIGGRPASELEKIEIIESIINDGQVKQLRPLGYPSYYVTPVLRMISNLKQENISPNRLSEIVTSQQKQLLETEQYHTKGVHKGKVRGEYADLEKTIAKNEELVHVYRRYEALLSEQNLYDFDDMITETVQALEQQTDMLRDIQENYLYVLADEHQDVNGAQNRILELITSFHDHPNIFAVGDEKQAIYRFQGASLENFLYFKEHFVDTKEIHLTDNYRSNQKILDAAHSLVETEDDKLRDLRVPLVAQVVDGAGVEKRDFSHQAVEDAWLIENIKERLATGIPAEEIAIIVRTNREVETFAQLLRKEGIAVTATADGDILHHPVTQAVKDLLAATIAEQNEEALFRVLHGAYWGIETNDLVKILSARSYQVSLRDILGDSEKLISLKVDLDSTEKIIKILAEARRLEVTESPHRVLEYLLQESGLIKFLIEHDPFEGTRVVRRIYDEVEEMVLRDGVTSLRQVVQAFTSLAEYNLPLNAPYISTNSESVQVMTAHKSKGLEFTVVMLPHLYDSAWNGMGKRTSFKLPLFSHKAESEHEVIEDERRLLYVAMTRAKQSLYLSYAETNTDGKELVPARLLSDIDEEFVLERETDEAEAKFNPVTALTKPAESITLDCELLKILLQERGFSATSLNNFLRSPWDYLYRNILRIPEVQPVHMLYGTVIHNTLEYITKHHTKTSELPSDSDIKSKLETELNRLPLTTKEYTRLLENGLADVWHYCNHLKSTLPQSTKEEMAIKVVLETGLTELPEVTLTGKLDRLDLNESGEAVRVVDYKTGKPKSRNAIEGKTKSDDGGYKRQLVFYALLLSLYDDERYLCRTGTLSFVQAKPNGDIAEESFTISDEEIDELKQEIIQAVQSIISGKFLTTECDDKVSEYCELVKLLRR